MTLSLGFARRPARFARANAAWAALGLGWIVVCCSTAVVEQPGAPQVEPRGQSEYGAIEYVKTSQRAGATQGFLLLHARSPEASAILFTGGDGVLHLQGGGTLERGGNFLVRVRNDFVAAGYDVALVDTPSDQRSLRDFRTTAAHAADIKGVIAYLRGLHPGPVWVVGTSRGTVSAANVAARLRDGGPDGVVLTSAITLTGGQGQSSVYNTSLVSIRVPVLIVSHAADSCPVSPAQGSRILAERWKGPGTVDFVTVSGGKPSESGQCEPFSPHGYFGIEQEATGLILRWMKAHEPRR